MTTMSALENTHVKGLFGDYKGKNENELIKITEIKDVIICQIVKYKSSLLDISKFNIDGLTFPSALNCSSNTSNRILWMGPDNWLVVSTNLNLIENIKNKFDEDDFAFTDLSHSRAIIELEGKNTKEVLKKGCPYNFNELKKNNCLNSSFNGMSITVDILNDNPNRIRIFSLRSFGESLYHSITDACLEFGYNGK